ncbi:MAG TPA: ISNCY family transposase [Patescibacteria group bacterium]|nr:ISNCY family transposase [Patescibacteria group bacterium]
MARKELNQISVFEDLKNKKIKQGEAVKMLNLSLRQVKRKIKEYRRTGAVSLIHKSRGKPSNHHLPVDKIKQALDLVREKYADFGPTFAAEKLLEIDGVAVNPETLRLRMIEVNLWKPKIKKVNRHYCRERKESLGEMVQIDGSPHHWFEQRGPACTLLAFIDDATSKVLHLEFAESESTAALMKSTEKYLIDCGRPASLYADRGSVYKVNLGNEDGDKITQYKRALDESDIGLIWARSPQAKGRVERLFKTLQDRLVKELRLRGISDIKTANQFLKAEYIDKHNKMFAVAAKSKTDLHRPIIGYDMGTIFCLKEKRKINCDMTIRYKNSWLQLEAKQQTLIFPKNIVEVWESLDGEVTVHLRTCQLNFNRLAAKPLKIKEMKEPKPKTIWTPPANHPWKRPWHNYQKRDISILEKSDILILA